MGYGAHIRSYLKHLQQEYQSAKRSGQHTAELSYRPVLDGLLHGLARDFQPNGHIEIVLEPRSQGRVGRPDWRIHDGISLGIYGYVEAKGLTEGALDLTPYQQQIDRYLTLGHKLLITDGIDFVFCMQNGAKPVAVSLIDKARLSAADWSRLQINLQLELLMRQFFASPAPQQCDEKRLVELVAVRTRLLADDIMHYAAIPLEEALNEEERQAIRLLENMRELIYMHNDQRFASDKAFADFTAQTIMFCLLYAHRVICAGTDSPSEKERKIREYISRDLTEGEILMPFRNLMVYLRDEAGNGMFLTQWVDECIQFLSFMQMSNYQLLNPDYHKLFELFLSQYDPQVRFDYGAYYTPRVLAGFVVRVTEHIVGEAFEGVSIYDDQNTIIDPCCGTGSFLEEIIRQDHGHGAYNLCGFEVMPAPYMLANYRMAVVARQVKGSRHRTNLILANTLSNCTLGEMADDGTIEGRELKRASELSALPLKLIIGNPPCSDSNRADDSEEFSAIRDLMDDFRPPANLRRSRQNIQKQINNPYMQFLRWSCEKLLQTQNHSALAFVVPLSFLEGESYRYARKYLAEHFSDIWVAAVDADARTGVRSDSLFCTMQGRAVLILLHRFGCEKGTASYHFVDFSHAEKEKKEELLSADVEQIMPRFREYPIAQDTCAFYPAKPFDEGLYESFWPVSGENGEEAVFLQHCSGIKLAPTALFTHVKAPVLKRRSKEIALEGMEAAKEWFSKQDRPPRAEKIAAFQSALMSVKDVRALDALLRDHIACYSFRPFMTSYVLLWKEVLHSYAKVGGGGTRLRKEIVGTYEDADTVGFAMAHAPKDLNPVLSQFASFCWYYPDNDMCTRGNSHIYMNQYLDKKSKKIKNNVNPRLLKFVSETLGISQKEAAKEIVFYVFAILCSQVYLDAFEGALFTVNQSDKRARVPIAKDGKRFGEIAAVGRKLAELERADFKPENLLKFDYEKIAAQIPKGFRLHYSVHPFDEEGELLILSDGACSIKIPCPLSLQKLNVSGYDVIKHVWLKFHSYGFTHCDFTGEDGKELLDFLNILAMHEKLVAQADEMAYGIVHGEEMRLFP